MSTKLRSIWNVSLSDPYIGVGSWYNGALTVNPGNAAVLVDTGALTVGDYLFEFYGYATAQALFRIQYRDSTNVTTQKEDYWPIAANSKDQVIFGNKITLAANERVRILLDTAITGSALCSIRAMEVPS